MNQQFGCAGILVINKKFHLKMCASGTFGGTFLQILIRFILIFAKVKHLNIRFFLLISFVASLFFFVSSLMCGGSKTFF